MIPKKRFWFTITFAALLLYGLSLWISSHYVVPVIMYHSIHQISTPHLQNAVTTSPGCFKYHLDFLKKNKYHVISVDELIKGIKTGRHFSHRTVVLTFDDGYEDNYTNAFPLLKQYQFPAAIFVVSQYIGEEEYLNWNQIMDMAQSGVTIGSHSHSHAYLPGILSEQQHEEILKSKEILEKKLGRSVDYFSYPVGGFNEQIIEITQRAGYKGAFTTNRGYNRYNKDVYFLKRIRLSDKDNSDMILWFKLSGFYNFFRTEKPAD